MQQRLLRLGDWYRLSSDAAPYPVRVMATQPGDLIGYWRLNELAGAVAVDSSGRGNHGAYNNITLAGDTGPYGEPTPTFLNSYVNLYSAGLVSDFSFDAGSFLIWTKRNGLDGVMSNFYADQLPNPPYSRVLVCEWVDQINIQAMYDINGAKEFVNFLMPALGTWFATLITWDQAADEVKVFSQGAQQGATQNGLAAWSGTLNPFGCVLGDEYIFSIWPFDGSLSDAALWTRALTDAEAISLTTI